MTIEDIKTLIESKFGEVVEEVNTNTSPVSLVLKSQGLLRVCTELQSNETTYFDMLSCITGIDNGAEAGTMEVAYNLT